MILPKPVILLLCPHFIYWISHQADYVYWRDLFTRTDRALAMISVNQSVDARECVCAFAINYYIYIAGGAYSKEGSIWSSSVAFSFLRQVHTSPCTTTSQPPA